MATPKPERPKDAEDRRANRLLRELDSLNLKKLDGPTLEVMSSHCFAMAWRVQAMLIIRAKQGKDGRQLR